MIANAGIKRIIYGEFYRDQRIFEVAQELSIELIHLQS
jgi:dCMP deaminase